MPLFLCLSILEIAWGVDWDASPFGSPGVLRWTFLALFVGLLAEAYKRFCDGLKLQFLALRRPELTVVSARVPRFFETLGLRKFPDKKGRRLF